MEIPFRTRNRNPKIRTKSDIEIEIKNQNQIRIQPNLNRLRESHAPNCPPLPLPLHGRVYVPWKLELTLITGPKRVCVLGVPWETSIVKHTGGPGILGDTRDTGGSWDTGDPESPGALGTAETLDLVPGVPPCPTSTTPTQQHTELVLLEVYLLPVVHRQVTVPSALWLWSGWRGLGSGPCPCSAAASIAGSYLTPLPPPFVV